MDKDTISAISTPPGEGGIGIIRLSGPQSHAIGMSIFCFKTKNIKPKSHHLYYGYVSDSKTENYIDEALISFMSSPYTYTKEDVVEINCHGGIIPLSRILDLTLRAGARLAEPGEFTKRAFLNGRLDLAQAEAVIHIIRAKTEAAMSLGLSQLRGCLSGRVQEVRQRLLGVLTHIEASIDFPEHQDVEELAQDLIAKEGLEGLSEIRQLLDTADKGRILREGLRTAIVGRPNVGKSSLLNSMLREQRAIVTSVPGTTRDLLEESLNIGGVSLTIVDTAGIRKTEDEVEKIGVARSREALLSADLVLVVVDVSCGLTVEDKDIINSAADKAMIVIANKTDLVKETNSIINEISVVTHPHPVVPMSLINNQGLAELEESIKNYIFGGKVTVPEYGMVSSVRHKEALRRAESSLSDLLDSVEQGYELDILSIDLYSALEALGEITGETLRSEVVDNIFQNFCIGK